MFRSCKWCLFMVSWLSQQSSAWSQIQSKRWAMTFPMTWKGADANWIPTRFFPGQLWAHNCHVLATRGGCVCACVPIPPGWRMGCTEINWQWNEAACPLSWSLPWGVWCHPPLQPSGWFIWCCLSATSVSREHFGSSVAAANGVSVLVLPGKGEEKPQVNADCSPANRRGLWCQPWTGCWFIWAQSPKPTADVFLWLEVNYRSSCCMCELQGFQARSYLFLLLVKC